MNRDEFWIAGIPADTPEYRALLRALQLPFIPELFPPPYKDSILENCEECSLPTWFGPACVAKRVELNVKNQRHRTVCLLCAARLGVAHSGHLAVVALTSKRQGE